MKKRIIAMALCLAMTLSLFPTGAFANPENEPAAPSSEAVAELVQEQQTEALPEAAAETEKTENEAPAVPVTAEAEIAAEAEKAESEASSEPAKADSKPAEPEKAESEASSEPEKADSEPAEPEKAESEASSEPEKADSEPVESEAETAKEPAEENSGSKWDALKNSIGNWFGGAVQPFSITHDLKVDTYKFFVGDEEQENWTQRVAVGDTLKIPGTPQKDGYVFEGWFIGEQKLTDGMTPTVTGGKTVRVDAKFKAVSYVHFMGTDGTTVMRTVQGTSGEAVSEADISTAAEMVRLTLGGEQSVQGWSTEKNGTPLDSNSIKFTEGTLKLFPVVKEGYWVTFDSKGGSYIAPKFSIEGETLDLSDIKPTKAGYDFVGWYLNEQKVTSVDGAATVTASWKAKDAQYTVIYWQENADDDGYSFAKSETKKGTAGKPATPSQKSYDGFTLNEGMSESKTIAGDGSTILNVYYKRNVYEVKFYKIIEHTWSPNEAGDEYTDIRITAKYGQNISEKWPTIDGSSTWKTESGAYQANIDTMPLEGAKFYGPKTGDGSETAYYYVEALPSEKPETYKEDIGYKLHHKDTSPGTGYYVTEEDRYPITGFTLVEDISTKIRGWYNNAKFYYSRNSYDIVFYSGNTIVHRESRQFQQSIADVNYKPEKPDNIPANYQFAGWYANELCEGDAFKFEGTMPAKNITLYAKWAAPKIYVTIPKEGSPDPYRIEVPYGSKLVDSDKWNDLLKTLEPKPDAWMIDGKIFNLDTELYENITLTPYYISDATQCTITYDENGIPRDDPTKYAKGSTATILNPTPSEGLKFQHWKLDNNTTLLPGQSITVTGDVTLTAVYGEPPENLTLTYHNGDKTKVFENLPANSKQIAKNPATLGADFETPEGKKFAGWATTENGKVKYQAGDEFYITKDGSNDLYAIWKDLPDISDKSVASINDPTNVTYDGNSHQWEPTVTKAGTQVTLKKDTDYTVSYSTDDFTNVTGTITVTITGIGDYTGKVEKTYQITKRNVTLTSASAEKVYDETPLTKHDVAVTGDGFVKDEGATYNVTGSQTVVGGEEGNNTFTYTLKDNTNADNYNVTTVNGTLKVTAKGVTADGMTVEKPADVKYNGESQQQKPVVKDGDKVLEEDTDYTLSYSADTTNAGTVTVTVTGIGNYTGSVEKTYQITKRTVTLTSETASKAYDGTPLTRPNVKVEGDGFVAGEVSEIKATGSVTTVTEGQVTNTITFTKGEKFKDINYAITKTEGKLSITGQSIVPDPDNPESYKGITISDPTDVTYDGKEHKWAPEVKDKEGNALTENTDYTVSYDKDDFTNVTGTITVTITGIGNYTGTVTRTYEITPAPLKITTNSAEKTYDESALTAGGKIEGVVERDKDEVKLNITGSQTEVGSSQNTYEIVWGNAKKSNYEITEDIGTLKVNARSGGGSSKPTPEEEPTPTPTPTPLPTTPAPTTPARRVTRSTATVTEPASRPTEQITENETPKAESEPEVIEDEETPLAPMATGAWALVNLILMLLTVLASLLLLLGYLGKKKYAKEDEYGNALHDANGNEIIDYTRNKKGFWRVASLIPAIAAVIAFALTENMRLPMVMTDRWTLLMVIIAVVQLIVAVLCKKKKESEEDENQANA